MHSGLALRTPAGISTFMHTGQQCMNVEEEKKEGKAAPRAARGEKESITLN